MKYDYYLAYDDGNMVLRQNEKGTLQKLDKTSGAWNTDDDLYRAYFGDMPLKAISVEEIKAYI